MKSICLTVLLAIVGSTALRAAPAPSNANPIRVLLVDGQSGGPYHVWQLTSDVMKKELEDARLFRVTVATSPRFGEDFSNFKSDFNNYQAVILNYDLQTICAYCRVAQFSRT